MKQEKHKIRCSEIEKRLGKYCFFEKSYKNTRTKKRVIQTDGPLFGTFKHFNKFNDAGIWGSRKINPVNLKRPEGMETLRPLAYTQALRNLKFSKKMRQL